MQKFIILLLLFSFSPKAFPDTQTYSYDWAFKAAGSVGSTLLTSLQGEEETTPSIGFNLHFGYRWTTFELNLSSYVNMTYIHDHNFEINGSQVRGRGFFRSVAFGPMARVFLTGRPYKQWRPYLGFGPLLALQTIKIEKAQVTGGQYSIVNKLTYESAGGLISIGFEEFIPKLLRPSFIEFSYKYLRSYKRNEIGGTKKEVLEITEENDKRSISEHTLLVSLGVLIF